MADSRSVLKEYRHLDEKLRTVGLSGAERARWEELRDLVEPPAPQPGFDVGAAAETLRASLEPAGVRPPSGAPEPEPRADWLSAGHEPGAAPLDTGAVPLDPSSFQAAPAETADFGHDAGAQPYDPDAQPYDPDAQPYDPSAQPYDPSAQPYDPSAQPYDPNAQPYDPGAQPYDPNAQPYDPGAQPYDPGAQPYDPGAQPYDPSAQPYDPSYPSAQPYDLSAQPYAADAPTYDSETTQEWSAASGDGEVPGGAPLDPSALPPAEALAEPEAAEPDLELDFGQPDAGAAEDPSALPASADDARLDLADLEPETVQAIPFDAGDLSAPSEGLAAPSVSAEPAGDAEPWDSSPPPNVADAPPVPFAAADLSGEPPAAPAPAASAATALEPEPVDLEDLIIEEGPVVEGDGAAETAPAAEAEPPVQPPAVAAAVPIAPSPARPLPAPPRVEAEGRAPPGPSPSFVRGPHRVVIHTLEGQVKRGVVSDAELDAAEVALSGQPGGGQEVVPASKVKAIFFMLGPGEALPPPAGKKVRVTFRDGRQVAGFSPDYDPGRRGFFMRPADTRTNTARIWVYREAVREVSIS